MKPVRKSASPIVRSSEPSRLSWVCAVALLLTPTLRAQDFNHTPVATQSKLRSEAIAALEAHEFPRALKLLAPLAEASPKDAKLLYDLGSAQDALDQTSAAEASYRTSIADDAALLEPRVALGLLLARNGHMPEARTEFLAATAIPSGDPALRAHAYRALAHIDERAHPADARDELLAALKLSPETPEDTLLSAELAAVSGTGAAPAEAAYRRVLDQHPNEPDAVSGLAHLLVQSHRTAEAEPILTAALTAHPGDPSLTIQLASVFNAEGKPALALPLVEGLTKANPQDSNIRRVLAGLYIDTFAWDKAEPLLATLTAQDPHDTRSIDDRGRALVHLRRYSEAQQILTRIVAQPALFPTPAALGDAAGHLAFASSENNDPAAALQAIAVRATVLPNSPEMLFVAAISYDKLHQVTLAQKAYKQFLGASKDANPDQEFQARHRLVALEHRK